MVQRDMDESFSDDMITSLGRLLRLLWRGRYVILVIFLAGLALGAVKAYNQKDRATFRSTVQLASKVQDGRRVPLQSAQEVSEAVRARHLPVVRQALENDGTPTQPLTLTVQSGEGHSTTLVLESQDLAARQPVYSDFHQDIIDRIRADSEILLSYERD